jgi:hypothetical protein
MGVNEYIVRPINPNELLARVRIQVKRNRYIEHLRVRCSMKHHQIRRNTRGIDLNGRLGGEEFVVVMPDSDPSPRPITWASAWMAAAPFELGRRTGTSSYGRSNPPMTTPELVLKRADQVLCGSGALLRDGRQPGRC